MPFYCQACRDYHKQQDCPEWKKIAKMYQDRLMQVNENFNLRKMPVANNYIH